VGAAGELPQAEAPLSNVRRVARRIWIAAIAAGLLGMAPSQAPAAVPKLRHEGYSTFLSQVSSGKVATAVLVPKEKLLHARLKRGTRYSVRYPAGADRRLVRLLHAKRVHVAFTQPSKRHHHHGHIRRRVIAVGAISVLALVVLASYLLRPRPPKERPAAPQAGTSLRDQPEA
jgi:hypothetical protein